MPLLIRRWVSPCRATDFLLRGQKKVCKENATRQSALAGALAGTHRAGASKSALTVATVATAVFAFSLIWLWLPLPSPVRAYGFMLLFMGATYGRMVAATVLAAAIPSAAHRGGFSVLQTA
ncbi:MAG: hypothetical protein KA498_10005, partial [Neisseriaceae bacterium]|nr:hypothetical protein [Neisseriaceae bacterium]